MICHNLGHSIVRVLAILIVKLHSIVVHSPQIGLWGKLGNARLSDQLNGLRGYPTSRPFPT